MKTGREKVTSRAAAFGLCLALGAGAAAAGETWYAVYLGGERIGYAHTSDTTAAYNGANCRYLKNVTEIHKGGLVSLDMSHEDKMYFDRAGLLAFASTRDDDGTKSTVTGTRNGGGDFTFRIMSDGVTEVRTFKAAEFDTTSWEPLAPCLQTPGDTKTLRIIDLEALKVKKTKLSYVEDASVKVNGSSYPAIVVSAVGTLEKAKYWLAGDRATAYRIVKNNLWGKITIEQTTKAGAQP